MEFIPAGKIIGASHQMRTVGIRDSRQLPDGNYRFVDTYCKDPSCDCRKTMILVFLKDVHVSTINFGWEPESYYQEWMGSKADPITGEMSGASIDITSPDGVSAKGMLAFFIALLDEDWIARFRAHYAAVKLKLSGAGQGKNDGRRTRKSRVRLRRP
ncbi:MAG: hypothetical protein O3B24_04565 [Verrucomicrobia bacterium]|nr:hypothetical protein [Verrucomicrobiota bacterium]